MGDRHEDPTETGTAAPPDEPGYLPALPSFSKSSPAVVLIHDKIRRELDDVEGFEEFCWFAREYPRCYRFHFDGAEFRLQSVYRLMRSVRSELAGRISAPDGDMFETSLSDIRVAQVYWDFESYLSE